MKFYITGSGDVYSSSGICVEYIKSRRTIYIDGWYDSGVGIQGGEFDLSKFFGMLGITRKDCKKAFKEDV